MMSKNARPLSNRWTGQTQRARPTVHQGAVLAQRAGQEGRGPELTDGPMLRQGDTFPILKRAQGYTDAAVGVQ